MCDIHIGIGNIGIGNIGIGDIGIGNIGIGDIGIGYNDGMLTNGKAGTHGERTQQK